MTDPGVWPGVWSTVNVRPATSTAAPSESSSHLVGFGERLTVAEECAGPLRWYAGQRISEHCAVVSVHPAGRVVGPADREYGPHVVEVPVREQDGDGLKPVFADHLRHRRCRVLARIDDDALRTVGGSHYIAVGGEHPGREAGDEHFTISIG